MHLFKYAFRNISRTKGRSILIGIIVLIIAFALCIGLCIRQSVETSKEEALAELEITAQISPNREKAMEEMRGGNFEDMEDFDPSDIMGESLTLDEMRIYAEAESVQSFHYTLSASLNGSGELEPYSTSSDDEDDDSSTNSMGGFGGGFGMGGGMQMNSGDFTVEGYSSDEAMTQFVDGTSTIEEGQVFEEGTDEMVCIISNELAAYNSLEVGDIITLASTEDEEETYTLEIVGIYNNSQASAEAGSMMGGMGGFGGFSDPANSIYTSYETLNSIVEASETVTGTLNGTYVLGSVEAYEAFESEVEALGLSDEYTVSSSDINAYEQSAQPLDNLAKMAGYFLIVFVLIGAIILVVLNIFATRERKYEIGVLTAIGMKKNKVAGIFMMEILIITLAATIVGGAVGAAVSVPVADTLLEAQMESQQNSISERNDSFGRDFNMPPGGGGEMGDIPEMPGGEGGIFAGGPIGNYVTDISASVNLTVLAQMLAISIGMAVIAGMVSVVAIMRYEPLQILSNRD